MKKDLRVYIDDVVKSSNLIAKYIDGKSEQEFNDSEELQDAVIRRLEIIGEAIKRLPMEFREQHSEIEWKKATGLRDILIHHYDEVETKQIWFTITEIMPAFTSQIEELLAQLDSQS